MIEQNSKNKVFYSKDVVSYNRIDFIEFSDDAITIWYSSALYMKKTSLTILFKDIENVSFEFSRLSFYQICYIKFKSWDKNEKIVCGSYKKSDLKQIKEIFNNKNIHVYWLPDIHIDLFRYSDDDKKWPIFSCWAKEWYRYWLRIFVIITLIIWWVSSLVTKDPSYKWDSDDIMAGILRFWIPAIWIILFLLLIIKDTHLWLTVVDDGIIIRMYDFSHDHIERIKVTYNNIENIAISQISKNRYDIKIKTKWNNEFEVKNLKKWKKLEEELRKRWMNKVNFIPENEEIVKVDPPYI